MLHHNYHQFLPTIVPAGWTPVHTQVESADGGGFAGYTVVNLLAGHHFYTARQLRLTFSPNAAINGNTNLSLVYVGHPAASGDPYDFDGGQVQVLFGGAATQLLTQGGADVVSDAVTFSPDPARALLVAMGIGVAGGVRVSVPARATDRVYYRIATAEAATTNKTTGYTDAGNNAYIVTKLEFFN